MALNRPTVRQGSTGPEVARLQEDLNSLNLDVGAADGIFGPRTEAGVRRFQAANDLTVDGIVGPMTWAALEGPPPGPELTVDLADFPALALLFRHGTDEDINPYLADLGIGPV
jgi:peptidoglycan hydrolase-like protein with peptidoglycan-binding domain